MALAITEKQKKTENLRKGWGLGCFAGVGIGGEREEQLLCYWFIITLLRLQTYLYWVSTRCLSVP